MLHSSRKTLVITGALSASAFIVVLLLLFLDADEKDQRTAPLARSEPISAEGSSIAPVATREGRRDELPSRASPTTESSAPEPAESVDRLDLAKAELASFATDSLYGVIDVDAVLENMLALASLPVEEHADFEYEDNDAIAYAITGLPEGMDGHMLVGLQPFWENGRKHRSLRMIVQIPSAEPEYLDGAMREGPCVSLSISYGSEDPATPVRFGLMLQRRVDLAGSSEAGIDAYSGRYTSGAYFADDMLDGRPPLTTTLGIVDGNGADIESFAGVSPLAGDTRLDADLLAELLAQLQENFSSVKGE